MTDHQDFKNGEQRFNIFLEESGALHFKSGEFSPDGQSRMLISQTTGQVIIGDHGSNGALQLRNADAENTAFLGGNGAETSLTMGGHSGQPAHVSLGNGAGLETVDLSGKDGRLILGADGVDGILSVLDSTGLVALSFIGDRRVFQIDSTRGLPRTVLDADAGLLKLLDAGGVVTAEVNAEVGQLILGAANGTDGDFAMNDGDGHVSITADGGTGLIECVKLTERPIPGTVRAKRFPLQNALQNVLALQGVRSSALSAVAGQADEIGLADDEVERILPELVETNAQGGKSIHYSRLSVVLAEAIKEQQQLIRELGTALEDAQKRITALEQNVKPR